MRDPDHSRRRIRLRGHHLSSHSLEHRLARIQQILALGLILLIATISVWISARTLERQETTFLFDSAIQMARSIAIERRDAPDLPTAAESALEENAPVGVYVRVLDAQNREMVSSPGQEAPHGHRREARAAFAGGGWVVVSMSDEPRRRAVLAIILALTVTALPLLLVVSASSRVIARRALRPLSRIASQAENTSWDGQVRRFGSAGDPAEIGALAGSFDRLLERLDEILRAERNFTQDAAHELRTPLTVLCGEIEYAVQDPSMPPHIRDGLDRALQQARAMSDLVEALLLLLQGSDPESKARGELAQPVNLSDLVRDLDREFRDVERQRAGDFDLSAEDRQVLVRETVRGVAASQGLVASLAPKPWPDAAGNGCHIHFSLWDDSGNRFYEYCNTGPGAGPSWWRTRGPGSRARTASVSSTRFSGARRLAPDRKASDSGFRSSGAWRVHTAATFWYLPPLSAALASSSSFRPGCLLRRQPAPWAIPLFRLRSNPVPMIRSMREQ